MRAHFPAVSKFMISARAERYPSGPSIRYYCRRVLTVYCIGRYVKIERALIKTPPVLQVNDLYHISVAAGSLIPMPTDQIDFRAVAQRYRVELIHRCQGIIAESCG